MWLLYLLAVKGQGDRPTGQRDCPNMRSPTPQRRGCPIAGVALKSSSYEQEAMR